MGLKKRISRGFISLELTIGLLVFMAGMSSYMYWLNSSTDRTTNAVATYNAKTVLDATQRWVNDNYATISAAANPYVAYDTTALAGYLPSGFVATNVYRQSYSIRVNKVAANRLEILIVTTGGDTISDKNLVQIASKLEGQGGYIGSVNPNTAQGTAGGWSYPMSSYGGTPGAGKVAIALFFQNGTADDPSAYLHRYAVAGRPEYNQMQTAIDMAGNNLNNAGALNAQSANIQNSSGNPSIALGTGYLASTNGSKQLWVQNDGGLVVANSNGSSLAQVQAGSLNTSGNVTAGGTVSAQNPAGYGPTYLQSYGLNGSSHIYVEPSSGSNLYLTTSGWNNSGALLSYFGQNYFQNRVIANEYLQLNTISNVGWGCGQNGLVSRDASGTLLYCKNGLWTQPGSVGPFLVSGSGTCDYSTAVATCPAGSKLLSGGYVLTWFNGSSFSHAPDGSYPDAANNRWVLNGSGTNQCFQSYASCTY